MTPQQLARHHSACIRRRLTADLLKPEYRRIKGRNRVSGHCYVASEALFHKIGGFASTYRPKVVRHEGHTHWFLECTVNGYRQDITRAQFKTPVPYEQAKWCGFLTRQPSKRCQKLLARL